MYVIIKKGDPDYPKAFNELYDPPKKIYCLGDTTLLKKTPKVTIIGNRYMQTMSKIILKNVLMKLNNEVIVSSFAKGVEQSFLKMAINQNLKAIIILGSGFNWRYPSNNETLYNIIYKNHLIISEYPPNTRPIKKQFIARSRLLAALAERLYVVEAKMKSDTMITVDLALELGREIYVPDIKNKHYNYEGIFMLKSEGANSFKVKGLK